MHSLKILDIFYGNKCNLTCFQCDTRSDIFRKGEHDPEIENIKQGIQLVKEKFFVENYTLLGGEPLLYTDKILDLVKFLRSIDPTTTLIIPTNGALINKHLDFLADLILNYRVLIVVSNHFSGFVNKSKSNELKKSVLELGNRIGYERLSPTVYPVEIFDWNNKRKDPLWQQWLESINFNIADENSDDILFLKNRSGIYLKTYDTFQKHYYLKDNKPKPFNSDDPKESYRNGCCSPFCTFMKDKKLYKCGALGTLEKFLKYHNSYDDPDWQKYINYKPLDLETCTEQEVEEFSNSKYKSIDQCTMCPKVSENFKKTEEYVIPVWKKNV